MLLPFLSHLLVFVLVLLKGLWLFILVFWKARDFPPWNIKIFSWENWSTALEVIHAENCFTLVSCSCFPSWHYYPGSCIILGTLLTEEGIERPCRAADDKMPMYRLGWCWDITCVWKKQMCRWQGEGKVSGKLALQPYLHRFMLVCLRTESVI